MIEFTHKPPDGYSYEFKEHKRGVIAIWLRHHREYIYNSEPVSTIWGFYHKKSKQFYPPINAKRMGNDPIELCQTTPYTAMPILRPLTPSVLNFL
tara:strand:+ start:536 stop:820 length:285 start_codon:yes stop_codon:yes gene_type:complete